MYRLWYPRGIPKDPSTLSLTEDLKKKKKTLKRSPFPCVMPGFVRFEICKKGF